MNAGKTRELGLVLMSRRLWLIFLQRVARASTCVRATWRAPQTLRRVERRRVPLCARRTRNTHSLLSPLPPVLSRWLSPFDRVVFVVPSSPPRPLLPSTLCHHQRHGTRKHAPCFPVKEAASLQSLAILFVYYAFEKGRNQARNFLHAIFFPPCRRYKINKSMIVETRTQND